MGFYLDIHVGEGPLGGVSSERVRYLLLQDGAREEEGDGTIWFAGATAGCPGVPATGRSRAATSISAL